MFVFESVCLWKFFWIVCVCYISLKSWELKIDPSPFPLPGPLPSSPLCVRGGGGGGGVHKRLLSGRVGWLFWFKGTSNPRIVFLNSWTSTARTINHHSFYAIKVIRGELYFSTFPPLKGTSPLPEYINPSLTTW